MEGTEGRDGADDGFTAEEAGCDPGRDDEIRFGSEAEGCGSESRTGDAERAEDTERTGDTTGSAGSAA